MSEKKLACLECGQLVANTSNVLARHIRSTHGIEWPDYVVKHEHGGVWPTCACGCGERVTWKKGGFSKYAKGHDGRAPLRVTLSRPGWVVNPFTAREERLALDDEIALLEHCALHGDPVTHDHGLRIPWEDASKRIRLIVPSFKHIKKNVILTIDDPRDPEYGQRFLGMKDWCNEHGFMVIVLKRDPDGFQVVGGFRPKEFVDAPS